MTRRVAELEHAINRLRDEVRELSPTCASCGEKTMGWRVPSTVAGCALTRGSGIDPATGHKKGCEE